MEEETTEDKRPADAETQEETQEAGEEEQTEETQEEEQDVSRRSWPGSST